MSNTTMEVSEISCSPVLTDTGLSEKTISFDNDEKIVCKYPEQSLISPVFGGMQPVLSGGSNSDRSVTYTGLLPKDDLSSLQYTHKTVRSDETNNASDINHHFKEPLPSKSKFRIKPVDFYNCLKEMSVNNEDDCEVSKSPEDVEALSEISNLQNLLNDTDICTSKSTKTKSSGFWRKSSRMVNSYVFEAALDETSLDNTIDKSNIKFTFRRNRRSEADENCFTEAFDSRNISDSGESMEDTNKVKGKSLDRTSIENSLIKCNIKTTGFKINTQSNHTEKRFSEAFNNTESSEHSVSEDIVSVKAVELSIRSHLDESLQNCGNFRRDLRNNKQMVTSSVFQDVFSGTDKSCDNSVRTDLASENQHNFDNKNSDSKCEETSFEEKTVSTQVEENDCSSHCKLNENESYNKSVSKRKGSSLTLIESEAFKKPRTNILLPNFAENNENGTKKINSKVSQNNRNICESEVDTIHNQSRDKENKQNEILNTVENFGGTDRILENSAEIQIKEGSHYTPQQICKENISVDKIFHTNFAEEGMKKSKTKENDQANLGESEYFKIVDNENSLNPDTTNLEPELKTSSSKDSFCLEIQEEISVLAEKICIHTNPDEGKKSATGDAHVVFDTLPHNENTSVLLSTDNVSNKSINSENNEGQTASRKENMKNGTTHLCQTVGDNNSLNSFQSLVYEQSDGKSHEEMNDRTSALLEFHASKSLKYSSSMTSVLSTDSSQQNTDLSKLHLNIKTTQITNESATVLNSLNNSLISTADSGSENNNENAYEPTEMSTLNNSFDSTLTENRIDYVSDETNNTRNSKSLIKRQSTCGITPTEYCNNINQQDSENIIQQSFSKSVGVDIKNKSRECKEKKEQSNTAVQGCATKSFLQESLSLESRGGKYQSLTSRKRLKSISTSALTPDGSQRKRKSKYLETNNARRKSSRLSKPSKETQNISSSINMVPTKNSNVSSTQGSLVRHQTTKIKHSEQNILEGILPPEVSSKNDIKIQVFRENSENKSLSDCSHSSQLHSKISNTSNQSQASRKILKKYSENNQKQADIMVKDNNVSENNNRSRNNFSESIDRSIEVLKQTNKIDKSATVLKNSNRKSEVTTNSTVNMEINNTLQHDESNEDNGYDVGYNTFSGTNVDYTPCNEAVIKKRNNKRKLNALRKCLFNSSFLQNETDAREFSIPFSELHKRTEKLLTNENKFAADNSLIDNEFNDGPNMVQINSDKQFSKHRSWATKATKDFIISKLKPKYGVKANWRCQKLVEFMTKKISETIRNSRNYNVPVDEIKLELARLNIIETNMDFHMFVLKYFRKYERDFVYKSVPCIQTFGRPNMVPRPPNSFLREKIL